MPRNRRPQDREEKRAEIVAAASRLFTEGGYDDTSMAAIARGAGVTPTTIYWYFEDKDALLVAVLDHVLENALADFDQHAEETLAEQLWWAIEQLDHHRRLMTVVHARTAVSTAIDTWHRNFHDLVDQMSAGALRSAGVDEPHLAAMSRIATFVIEGLLTHPHTPAERREVAELLASLRP